MGRVASKRSEEGKKGDWERKGEGHARKRYKEMRLDRWEEGAVVGR